MARKDARCSDGDFISLIETQGPAATARILNISLKNIKARRIRLEAVHGVIIPKNANNSARGRAGLTAPAARVPLKIDNGVLLIGSDSHYWPGQISAAHRAFVQFCNYWEPVAIIKNGDELDGATISRHPPIGWESMPTVAEEIECVKERLSEISNAVNDDTPLLWPLGNHDARYETRLATVAPEYAKVHGVHLKDHFPDWTPCWSVFVNDDLVVKHRYKGGLHASHNNVLWAGRSTVTGHLHRLRVTAYTDYNGTRYGIECGTIAEIRGPQFQDYTETNPLNWQQGFIFLTFKDGKLMWPEIVATIDDTHVQFRGEIISV